MTRKHSSHYGSGNLNLKSTVLIALSLILISFVVALTDFSPLPNYVADHSKIILLIFLLGLATFLMRILRNYYVLKMKGFIDSSLIQFLPKGILAGVVATYGPMKSGEIVAVEIYKDNFLVKRGQSLSVIAVGRVMDVLTIVSFISTSILLIPSVELLGLYTYLGFLISILIIVITALLNEKIGTYILRILQPLFVWRLRSVHTFLSKLAIEYYRNLKTLKEPMIITTLLGFTMGRWILELFSSSLLFQSFGIELSTLQLMSILGFSYSIGVSSGTPGALGSSQLTSLGLLVIFGIDTGVAALALLVGLAISTSLNLILLGIASLWSIMS